VVTLGPSSDGKDPLCLAQSVAFGDPPYTSLRQQLHRRDSPCHFTYPLRKRVFTAIPRV
jgi:hypothetical protein